MPIAMNEEETREPMRDLDQPSSARLWLWLALGSILLLFSYGADNIALAAWLAPIFLLRFVRNKRWRVWLPLLYVAQVVGSAFQLRGMVADFLSVGYYLSAAIAGVQALVPYAMDRWLARRVNGLTSTLIFPCTWAAVDYVASFGPYGSWGAYGYSQYGNLPLLQLLSVTGLWGLTFLIAWPAAVCNYVWDEGWNQRRARRAAWLCASTVGAVILFGGLRLTLFPPSSGTVRIASLSQRSVGGEPAGEVWDRLIGNQATTADLAAIRKWSTAVRDDLLERAEREAQSGAKIVFWAEGNAQVLKPDEAALLTRGSELSARYRIYLGMALAVWTPGPGKPLENKFVLVEPNGQLAWQYYKAHPVPGQEAELSVKKDGRLRGLETPFGRLTAAICYDADFPQLLAQAAALGSDILLVPSNDWRAIDPWHTQMARFRAIEQGVNLDRQASHGLSAAFDYQGRVLAAVDHFHSSDCAMVAEIPTSGVKTIYSRFGDWFGWLSLLGLVPLIAVPLSKGPSSV